LEEIARQHAEADDFLKRLKAIPTDGMADNDLAQPSSCWSGNWRGRTSTTA